MISFELYADPSTGLRKIELFGNEPVRMRPDRPLIKQVENCFLIDEQYRPVTHVFIRVCVPASDSVLSSMPDNLLRLKIIKFSHPGREEINLQDLELKKILKYRDETDDPFFEPYDAYIYRATKPLDHSVWL